MTLFEVAYAHPWRTLGFIAWASCWVGGWTTIIVLAVTKRLA